ncbi:hypothetical protein Q068_00195 [Pseudomonas aeruginosa BL14]|nr:hypothetical protein Q068_00195 [Pseudomonas aeruginosa BL14]
MEGYMCTFTHYDPLYKTTYLPLEAAIRWCALTAYEAEILDATNSPEVFDH